VLLAA